MAADAVTGAPLWSFPTNQTLAGVADDLHVRRQAVHRRRGRREHHRVRAPVLRCESPSSLRCSGGPSRPLPPPGGDRDGRIHATVYLPDAQPAITAAPASTGPASSPACVERSSVLRAVVRAVRSEAARRDHRAGRGVPDQRRRPRLRRGQGGRDVRADRRRRGPQAGRGGLSPLRHLPDRRPRHVDGRQGEDSDRLRPRARRDWRLRVRLPEDAAAHQELAGARASPEEHRPEADRDERLQPQLLHARRQPPVRTSSCAFRSRRARPGR